LIAQSKIVLSVHFYETRIFPIVRISYLLANKKCVITETGLDLSLETAFHPACVFGEAQALPALCKAYLDDDAKRHDQAMQGFQVFSAMQQVEYLRAALAENARLDAKLFA